MDAGLTLLVASFYPWLCFLDGPWTYAVALPPALPPAVLSGLPSTAEGHCHSYYLASAWVQWGCALAGGVTTCAVVSAGSWLVLPLGTSLTISRLSGNQQLSRGSRKSGEAQGGIGRCQCLALPMEVCKRAKGEMGGDREKGEAIEIEGSKRISSDCSKSWMYFLKAIPSPPLGLTVEINSNSWQKGYISSSISVPSSTSIGGRTALPGAVPGLYFNLFSTFYSSIWPSQESRLCHCWSSILLLFGQH